MSYKYGGIGSALHQTMCKRDWPHFYDVCFSEEYVLCLEVSV